MLLLTFSASSAVSQNGNCDVVASYEHYKEAHSRISQFPPLPSAPPMAEIPVIFYVELNNNGTQPASGANMTEADADAMLAQMNSAYNTAPPYVFNYVRCGRINFISNSQIQSGAMPVVDYAYSPWAVNIFIDQTAGNANAEFPWLPGTNNNIYFKNGYGLYWGTAAHEMGHSMGLFHTHGPDSPPYISPPASTQTDYPYNTDGWPRELVIRTYTPSATFKTPNHGELPENNPNDPDVAKGGDLIRDTPASCNPQGNTADYWPGCAFSGCAYSGTYVDYNNMPINDPNNILGKNIMSYGGCDTEFTPGQIRRAYQFFDTHRKLQYKPQWCGNLDDKVEFKGTSVGQNRVAIEFTQNTVLKTRAATNSEGEFNGVIQPNGNTGSATVSAKVRKLGSNPDFSFTPGNWVDGITTFDIVLIKKHILGITPLSGYDQIAADVNNSGTVTTFDINPIQRLLLSMTDNFPAFTQPWRFLRESVTLNNTSEFDGIGTDNPFQFPNIEGLTNYSMTPGKQGFDAVKLGDVNGSNSEAQAAGGNPPGIGEPLLVNIVKVVSGGMSTYQFKVDDFEDIVAYQMEIGFPTANLTYSNALAMDLMGVNPDFFGTTQASQGVVKTLWYDDANASAVTLPDGSGIFKLSFDGSVGAGQADVHLSSNIGFRADDDEPAQLRNFAYMPDGTIRPIIERQYNNGAIGALSVNPNPFTSAIRISIEAVNAGNVDINLFTSTGQRVHRSEKALDKGSSLIDLENLSHWAKRLEEDAALLAVYAMVKDPKKCFESFSSVYRNIDAAGGLVTTTDEAFKLNGAPGKQIGATGFTAIVGKAPQSKAVQV